MPLKSMRLHHYVVVLAVAMSLITVVALRIHWLNLPFERDEGEFAYIGQQMLHGVPPYDAAYTMKLPGTAAMYALFEAVGGETVRAVRTGMLVVNLLTCCIVYLLASRLFSRSSSLFAASFYGLGSISSVVLGPMAHATHFVVLFVCLGFYFLLRDSCAPTMARAFWPGLLFGLAVMMKQSAAPFALLAALLLLFEPGGENASTRSRRLSAAALIGGVCLPYLLLVVYIVCSGELRTFWFWTVTYARQYAGEVPLNLGLPTGWSSFLGVFDGLWPIMIVAGLGLILLFVTPSRRDKRFFLAGLLCVSAIAVSLDMFFRPHYFVMLLPALALLAASFIEDFTRLLAGRPHWTFAPSVVGLLAAAFTVSAICDVQAGQSSSAFMMAIYNDARFVAAPAIAAYIRAHSSPQDRLAMMGSEPEIYFYSHRLPAAKNLYNMPLYERQNLRNQMILEYARQIEAARPKYFLVFLQLRDDFGHTEPHLLSNWEIQYLARDYNLDSVWLFANNGVTTRVAADDRVPRDKGSVCALLFKRKVN